MLIHLLNNHIYSDTQIESIARSIRAIQSESRSIDSHLIQSSYRQNGCALGSAAGQLYPPSTSPRVDSRGGRSVECEGMGWGQKMCLGEGLGWENDPHRCMSTLAPVMSLKLTCQGSTNNNCPGLDRPITPTTLPTSYPLLAAIRFPVTGRSVDLTPHTSSIHFEPSRSTPLRTITSDT
jgi:hypothetical protein